MPRIAVLGLIVLVSGACFEESNPVDETGAMQSSGPECTAGTEGCPCIEGSCVGDLECLSNVCVDAGSTSQATGDTTNGPATTTPETSSSVGTTPTTLDEGPLDEGPVMTSDSGNELPQGSPCDPFFELCAMELACVGLDMAGFVCDVPGSGQQGDPCEQEPCGPGLQCMQAAMLYMCSSMVGCCSALCDLDGGSDQCPIGLVCDPFYPLMSAPPGYEHVGVCIAG